MSSWLNRLRARLVAEHGGRRTEAYREETVRVRRGDVLSWTLILTGFVPLALQKMALAPVWLALLVFCVVARRRGVSIGTPQAQRLSLFAAAGSAVYYVVTGDRLWAFTLFLVFIGAILVFKHDMEHEVQQLYLVAFVLFLVFAQLTLDYSFLVGLFAMVMSGLMVMIRYHFPEEVRPGRYLSVARLLVGPVLVSLLVAIPIFVVCPRVPVSLVSFQNPPHSAGFADKIRFGEMLDALGSDRVFMTVRTARPRKWRGVVLDYYDVKGWRRTQGPGQGRAEGRTVRQYSAPIGQPIRLDEEALSKRSLNVLENAEVILEPTDARFLFSPQFPLAIETDLGTIAYDQSRALMRVDEPQTKRIRYVVWFRTRARPLENQVRLSRRFLQLPPRLPARIGELARRVTLSARTDRERATMIDKFLAEGEFTYSLSTVPPKERDPIDHFLFEAKAGHCEYFSSAMVLMLRTVKVPARVVNGFNPGTFDRYAGTWSILERNSHSWVEVYLGPQDGWVEFDPTTGRGFEPPLGLAARLGLSQLWIYQLVRGVANRLDFEWQRWVVSFSSSMQAAIFQEFYNLYDQLEASLLSWWSTHRVNRFLSILAVFVAVVGILGRLSNRFRKVLARLRSVLGSMIARFWIALSRVLTPRHRPVGEAAFYDEMLRLLETMNLSKRPSETPREFAKRMEQVSSVPIEPLSCITEAYCQVVYRGRSLGKTEEENLLRLLVEIRRGLVRP